MFFISKRRKETTSGKYPQQIVDLFEILGHFFLNLAEDTQKMPMFDSCTILHLQPMNERTFRVNEEQEAASGDAVVGGEADGQGALRGAEQLLGVYPPVQKKENNSHSQFNPRLPVYFQVGPG